MNTVKPKLLITGISGFIGQALTVALHQDYEIIGWYETSEKLHKNPEVPSERKYIVDLRNTQLVELLIKQLEPDFVIHLAARSEVANSFDNYLEVTDINYRGTVGLAEANRRFNPNLQLFIMASTMETYGHHNMQYPFTETTAQFPMAPYAVAKVACEKYLEYMAYAYDFPFTILRQTNTYGRTDNNFFVVERIISQFYSYSDSFPVVRLGDPEPKRNFLHISDLVSLYARILERVNDAVGHTFVTGPDNALTIRDLAYLVAHLMGYQEEEIPGLFEWHTIPPRPGEIFYLNSNPAKAEKLLEWKPQVSLRAGLTSLIEWFDAQ